MWERRKSSRLDFPNASLYALLRLAFWRKKKPVLTSLIFLTIITFETVLWRLVTGWLKLILRSKAARFLLFFIVSYDYERQNAIKRACTVSAVLFLLRCDCWRTDRADIDDLFKKCKRFFRTKIQLCRFSSTPRKHLLLPRLGERFIAAATAIKLSTDNVHAVRSIAIKRSVLYLSTLRSSNQMERMKTAEVKTAEQSIPSKKDCTLSLPFDYAHKVSWLRDRATILYKQKL